MITVRNIAIASVLVALSFAPAAPALAAPVFAVPTVPVSAVAVLGTDPGSVVEAYYDAINAGDYRTAWELGGKNFGGSFERFENGFADTLYDDLTVDYTSGDVVHVELDAEQVNGHDHQYAGTYTVRGGEIVGAHLSRR